MFVGGCAITPTSEGKLQPVNDEASSGWRLMRSNSDQRVGRVKNHGGPSEKLDR